MHLGIDTSGAVSVAVGRPLPEGGVEVLAVCSDERARHHDEVLLALVDEVLAAAGARRADLTRIVVGRGPGPFTGLRVGLVVARTLAEVLGVPLCGLSSLDALAHQVREEPAAAGASSLLIALDARRREVYWASYAVHGERLERTAGPAVAPPADIADRAAQAGAVAGSGAQLYAELLHPTSQLAHVDAGHLLQEAADQLAVGADLSSTEPLYLREPDAAKPTARKSALGR